MARHRVLQTKKFSVSSH